MAGHPCLEDNDVTIPTVLLLKPESDFVKNVISSGNVTQLTIGRRGKHRLTSVWVRNGMPTLHDGY